VEELEAKELGKESQEVFPMYSIDMAGLDRAELYKLLTGGVLPRPIAWVSTLSRDGQVNLAPFSFYTVASTDPPTLCISIAPDQREGAARRGVKDTLANIEATGEYVVHLATDDLTDKVLATGNNLPAEVDEFELTGLTKAPSRHVRPYRIAESPVQMECRHRQTLPIGTDRLVLGEVLCVHIAEGIYDGDTIDVERLNPLSDFAAGHLHRRGEVFRPQPADRALQA